MNPPPIRSDPGTFDPRFVPTLDEARRRIAAVLRPGDLAVDATVGWGRDTAFLAELVGPTGQVVGFEIQDEAIRRARDLLVQRGLQDRVTLKWLGHERLNDVLDDRAVIKAAMFNLGYLPGSDHTVTTRAESTLIALEAVWRRLDRSGLVTIVCYPGHPGGMEETHAVASWAADRASSGDAIAWSCAFLNSRRPPPRLVILAPTPRPNGNASS